MKFVQSLKSGDVLLTAKTFEEALEEGKTTFDYAALIEEYGKEEIDQDIFDSITQISEEQWINLE